MTKYGSKAKKKISKVMNEYDEGTLKSSSGQKVTNRKQAIAIGISEAGINRRYPARNEPSRNPSKKSAQKSK